MSVVQARPISPVAPPASSPVRPPDDTEKYWYLGRQQRWLLGLQAVSFALIAYSVLRFATADIRLLLFLAPMSLYAVTLVISLTSGTRRRTVTMASHMTQVREWDPRSVPSVDVFLPTAGEPMEILRNTYFYVSQLAWAGRLNVYVLDDGARAEVRDLAEQHGFEYRTRPDRGHLKKAGNLLFGYGQSDGDLILILDADFVPRHDMLTELAPYFDDPDVGIVQSPQFFDTDTSKPWLQRCAGATQELFYRFIQPSRDRVGAAICVGTCAVYRRAGLHRAGGFAQIGHSEDVHTGVKILKSGQRVQYVPVLVSKGLCPDDPAAFLNQQYRWCSGSMSLLADKSFHEAREINLRQRLCFWAGFLYYISTAVNALVAPLPAIAMLWLLPAWVEPKNSIWLLGAVLLWFVVLPSIMHGRWRVEVLRIQHLYSFAHLLSIVHVMSNSTREWVATGSSSGRATPVAVSVNRLARNYIALTQLAIVVGLVRGVVEYGIGLYWVMVVLAALGAYIQWPLVVLRVKVRQPLTSRRLLSAVSSPRLPRIPRQRASPDIVGAPAAAGPRHFRPDIQGLRAVAIILVVLFHAQVPHVTGGYVGVDVFFVISGFLISSQLLRQVRDKGRVSLLAFYAGRMRRLLPPAVVVILATVVAARVWDSIFHVRSVITDAVFALAYGINYRLAVIGTDYQHANGPVSPLQHMWSLAVEEQFYVIWPLLLVACALVGRRHRMKLVGVVLVVVTAASLWVSVTQTASNPQFAYFGIHTRAWELLLGALLAYGARLVVRLPAALAVPLSWLGLTAIVVSAFAYDEDTAFPGSAALLPTLGAVAVIAGGMLRQRWGAEKVLAWRPMQGIGNVSYGWYLWHWPMIVIIPLAVGYSLDWPYLLSFSVLALWFAVLTHWLVERPAKFSRLRHLAWLGVGTLSSALVAVAALAMVLTLPAFVGTGAATQAVKLAGSDTSAVQAALVKGLSTMEAPRNLTPQPGRAASDQPVTSSDGCHASYTQVDQPACVFGAVHGAHTMVLFGDSHAQQWLPALDAMAKKLNWRVVSWTKAACPVADLTVHNSALGRDYTECTTWRGRTMTRIAKIYPDIVIVSQSDSVIGTQFSNSAWGDKTVQTLSRLTAKKLQVAYVLDTPMPQADVPECVATHLDNVGACNLSRSRSALYQGRRAALQAALTANGITAVDPNRWFCTTSKCPAVVGNILVYRDGSHMTAAYSDWLAPMTAPLFVARGTK